MPAKVCLIGAGPSGMSLLYQVERLRLQGTPNLPLVTCYEKQETWGGLWNYTWRTGLNEFGESVHGSMYRCLWSNAPKEALEYPDYTFEQHFGRPVPSFPPREVLLDYLCGRWNKYNLKSRIKFLHSVQGVTFDQARAKFDVVVKDLQSDRVLDGQEFDFVVNCTGHFSTPNVPDFKGLSNFPGRVLHSHELRCWSEFSGQRLLVVGASYSGEDIVLQAIKFGARSVVCSHRSRPLGFQWPPGISERPLLVEMDGRAARFKDGSSQEVDSVILATGYLHHYPYLSDSLRLRGANLLYPADLYKGTVWMQGGGNRMLYIGAQNQFYTFTMFDAQALWAVKYMAGDIKLPDRAAMETDARLWQERSAALQDNKSAIDFQTDFTVDLANEAGYGSDLDVSRWFHQWEAHKAEDIATYRDRQFASKFTGSLAPAPAQPFMSSGADDSMATFLAGAAGSPVAAD